MRQLVVSVPVDYEDHVIEALQHVCRLKNITRFSDGATSRISCYVAAQEAGIVLHELDKVGCGAAYGKVAMLPLQLLKPLPNVRDRNRHLLSLVSKKAWRVRGRMATEEIYTGIASGSELSFDYLAFVVVAGLIAAVGLATNSTVMIVASMLVSPLMGPILAFSFGTSVRDSYLIYKGVLAETVGVMLTFLVGLTLGFAVCIWTGVAHSYQWPTIEMQSRGEVSSLVVGVFFAVPSGAGVALSTTQGGTTALVGVAIAASLLPPIVNCGMCLAFAAAGARRVGLRASQFFHIAGMSLALFLINVVSIYSVCILFFWIKGIKKVRKQLSVYRDLPPIPMKVKADVGVSVASPTMPKHATTAPGILAGNEKGNASAGAGRSGGGGSSGGGGGSNGGGGQSLNDGEVAIKVGGASAGGGESGGAPDAHQPGSAPGSRHSSAGIVRRATGLFGSLWRIAGSGNGGAGSGTDNTANGAAAGAATALPMKAPTGEDASGQTLRGWGRVRKLVLEDKALQKLPEGRDEESLTSPRVHNI
ncbi:hypothetical protein Vafri_4754 [Volvox africanus]|uniref:DUF389 domain-containing protein n=1 Tax=Volvox africanus TaxID=51714 RepID=A0A8J4EUY9_9CHLO|nr:hypothetical protein Vafri_4754 [Volvox africanus]